MLGGKSSRLAAACTLTAAAVVVLTLPSAAANRTVVESPQAVLLATAPSAATIEIDPGAATHGYANPNITLAQGGTLTIVNYDSMVHTVTSDDRGADTQPLFDSGDAPGNGTFTSVPGVNLLAAGTYNFHCRYHNTVMVGTLTIEGGSGGVTPTPLSFDQPLFIPPVLNDASIRIPMKLAHVRVLPTGPLTAMWTFGGTYPGPTIIRPVGKDTKVRFVNNLPLRAHAVTIHYHGDHHASQFDGQPASYLIKRGTARTYDYPLTEDGKPERGQFNFYHDHRMALTSRNVWMGLEGMFITRDGTASKFNLPRGRYDVPLMITDRSFTSDNQLTNPFPSKPTMVVTGSKAPPGDGVTGTHILANGRYAPYFRVATHRYRLRLLNGSNFTSYTFQLSDGRPFVQIGTGNGLLPKPVVRQTILLGPAQRADVIVDFHRELNKRVVLQTVARTDNTHGGTDTPTAQIMQFRVVRTASDSTHIPTTLMARPHLDLPSRVAKTWTVNVAGDPSTGSYWTLNGKMFDPKRIDFTVRRGATQIWRLQNKSTVTHYIHLHEERWRTVSRDGRRPPPWERGLEDTWKLDPGENVTVAAKFTDYTGAFMIHCHMLDHEDHGLMAQFKVLPPRTTSSTTSTTALRATTLTTGTAGSLASLLSPVTAQPARPSYGNALFSMLTRELPASDVAAMYGWLCSPHKTARPPQTA
ncbi:MAG TPA: multicopper oxidase domain-containing protein [Mycobacteriales bacterium]|nr:multicopper oxidase domain-containing protein [Mycobacteriales bacterium]